MEKVGPQSSSAGASSTDWPRLKCTLYGEHESPCTSAPLSIFVLFVFYAAFISGIEKFPKALPALVEV